MDGKTMKRLDNIHVAKQLHDGGYNASEIAKLMNLPESVVRSYIS